MFNKLYIIIYWNKLKVITYIYTITNYTTLIELKYCIFKNQSRNKILNKKEYENRYWLWLIKLKLLRNLLSNIVFVNI